MTTLATLYARPAPVRNTRPIPRPFPPLTAQELADAWECGDTAPERPVARRTDAEGGNA